LAAFQFLRHSKANGEASTFASRNGILRSDARRLRGRNDYLGPKENNMPTIGKLTRSSLAQTMPVHADPLSFTNRPTETYPLDA
jgi:hypothetical protein